MNETQRFAKARGALLLLGPLNAGGRHLVQGFAGAEPEHDPSRIKAPQRGKRLRDDGGVVAIRGGEHARAHDDLRGARTEGPSQASENGA